MSVVDYVLVRLSQTNGIVNLEEMWKTEYRLKQRLNEGWTPQGGPVLVDGNLYQAMVRHGPAIRPDHADQGWRP